MLEYGYLINSNTKTASLLVDRNRYMKYNINKLEAPARLENIILAIKKDGNICMPRRWYKIKVEEERVGSYGLVVPSSRLSNAGRLILGMFSLDKEAVAKE